MSKIAYRVIPGEEVLFCPEKIPELTDIITADPHFRETLSWLHIYAHADLPVLITGEPGTGKELIARAICAIGPAWRQTCQRLNCASLTESLVSSELFGHVRGAFTGAGQARPGKFRLAHRGNLFLDEVGDLPLSIQPKLLRAVEQGEIEPVGGDAPVKVNVRLIAATNQDLSRLIAQGRFRQDLYDRLGVLAIHLPPLRERPLDIMLLATHFAQETARRYGRGRPVAFSDAARRRLERHAWRGNVRELKNTITRTMLLSSEGLIKGEDLIFSPHPDSSPEVNPARPEEMLSSRPSARRLRELLAEERGNVSALSRRLKVCSKTIYRWVRSSSIDLMDIRDAALI
jgi:anaerobic nitric oxide reductase transcription regulator